jgi:hypothetical protein
MAARHVQSVKLARRYATATTGGANGSNTTRSLQKTSRREDQETRVLYMIWSVCAAVLEQDGRAARGGRCPTGQVESA